MPLKSLPRLATLIALLLDFQQASGAPPARTEQACQAIANVVPDQIAFASGLSKKAYDAELKTYWNVALRDIKPTCIVLPITAEHVSATVKALHQFPDVKFVIKSGGHDPNPGHSSISDGVLLSLNNMRGTTLAADKKVAFVKPGGPWTDVITPLAKEGVTAVGGRLGIVGIGGYLTQGGLSFLSAQYGLAADNVVGWELVTANGSVVHVTPESHPDLAVALRGSGEQLGIVTQFTLNTHPIDQVWGGYRIFTSGYRDQILQGFHEFVGNPSADPKAAIIVDSAHILFNSSFYMVYFFYDGATPPKGAFGKLGDIKPTLDLCKTRTYPELLAFNSLGADATGLRTSFRSLTLPYMTDRPDVYKEIESAFSNLTNSLTSKSYISMGTLAFQAFPNLIGKQSEKRGGNAMGLSSQDKNRFIIELNFVWNKAEDDKLVWQIGKSLTDMVEKRIITNKTSSSIVSETYVPLFMNDAAYDQEVTSSYKNVQRLSQIQRQMDPYGFWKRAGGFKYQA
ncbi:FAD-binding domain-containing protein [Microthyrium microscopicum]|uniref:FAD-binding domain-containing protein n=1 Tax=Microthyrium microscopicum TaxID=703497 RepID=A0A6A6UFV9_9PEZI|nr:FAD-binding domain-containing protein [Microthyrium microscopicum]